MASEQDISEVVDEFVDTLNVSRIEDEADRLEITSQGLIDRIANEAKMRVER